MLTARPRGRACKEDRGQSRRGAGKPGDQGGGKVTCLRVMAPAEATLQAVFLVLWPLAVDDRWPKNGPAGMCRQPAWLSAGRRSPGQTGRDPFPEVLPPLSVCPWNCGNKEPFPAARAGGWVDSRGEASSLLSYFITSEGWKIPPILTQSQQAERWP